MTVCQLTGAAIGPRVRGFIGLNALLCAAALAMTAPARADDPGVVAACNKAGALPRPGPNSAGGLPRSCDALAFYYGIGRKPDYRAARACALNGAGDNDVGFGPAAILSMIYANGDGVSRDDDLAVAYACDAGGAPAEISGRVGHLLERKAQGAAVKDRFDFCNDITSGLMQAACASIDSRITAVKRDDNLAALTKGLPPKAVSGYATLRKAFDAYVAAVSDNEVDVSGTARGAMILEARDEEAAAFAETLRLVLSPDPAPAGGDLKTADAALNAAYRKVQAATDKVTSMWGTVTKDGVKTAQRAWLPYRDAFVTFSKAAGSKTSADRLAARLTERRTQSLDGFLGDDAR